jgi:hypothetical protein
MALKAAAQATCPAMPLLLLQLHGFAAFGGLCSITAAY